MSFISSLIFPPSCTVCGKILDIGPSKVPLCHDCRKTWNEITNSRCFLCGQRTVDCKCKPIYNTADTLSGYYYLVPIYSSFRVMNSAELRYADYAHRLIQHIKHERNRDHARFFARELSKRINSVMKEDYVVTYPPRSDLNKLIMGYDNARFLARYTAEYLDVEFFDGVRHVSELYPQKKLRDGSRGEAIIEAYKVKKKMREYVKDKRFVLIDDIVTTGATATAIATALLRCGAKEVCCFSIARTIYLDKEKSE